MHHEPVSVDPQQVADHLRVWKTFTWFTKWGCVSVAATLILMAIFLV